MQQQADTGSKRLVHRKDYKIREGLSIKEKKNDEDKLCQYLNQAQKLNENLSSTTEGHSREPEVGKTRS